MLENFYNSSKKLAFCKEDSLIRTKWTSLSPLQQTFCKLFGSSGQVVLLKGERSGEAKRFFANDDPLLQEQLRSALQQFL